VRGASAFVDVNPCKSLRRASAEAVKWPGNLKYRDASRENLAEGFSGNLTGRNGGLYHGKFQEAAAGLIQLMFQVNGIEERGPVASSSLHSSPRA